MWSQGHIISPFMKLISTTSYRAARTAGALQEPEEAQIQQVWQLTIIDPQALGCVISCMYITRRCDYDVQHNYDSLARLLRSH